MQQPLLTYQQMKFFFERFTTGDPSDTDFRQTLVDILISRIDLCNDHITIYYNAQDGQKQSPTAVPEGADMGRLVTRTRLELVLPP